MRSQAFCYCTEPGYNRTLYCQLTNFYKVSIRSLSSKPALTYDWKYIYQVALNHKKQLISAHLIAILATIASVPVPLLMPMLVDEVLLNKPGITVDTINSLFPASWHQPALYIGAILLFSVLLRIIAIVFNIIQARRFSIIAKDIIFRIRKQLILQLQTLSMAEYENLGSGTVVTYMVTDLDTIDNFIGSTISKLLVAILTVIGTAIILLWMHWQLGLFYLIAQPGSHFIYPSRWKKSQGFEKQRKCSL